MLIRIKLYVCVIILAQPELHYCRELDEHTHSKLHKMQTFPLDETFDITQNSETRAKLKIVSGQNKFRSAGQKIDMFSGREMLAI